MRSFIYASVKLREWTRGQAGERAASESFIGFPSLVSDAGLDFVSLPLSGFFHVGCLLFLRSLFVLSLSLSVRAAEASLRHCCALRRLLPPSALYYMLGA